MVECTAPFPACPDCGCPVSLPPFAQPHQCKIRCHCGVEFDFDSRCGRIAGQCIVVFGPGEVPVWRIGAACWPHARLVLHKRDDVMLVGLS